MKTTYIVSTLFLCVVSSPAAIAGDNATRPNVVLIVADDLGWGDVGYNNHPHLKTPHLNKMAANGLRFNRFYAAYPVCSPTRGSIMTGRHPARFGCFAPNFSIRPEEVTIAEVLRAAGYVTGHFGKWHLGPVMADTPVNPGASGFDTWVSHDNWFDLNPSLSRNGKKPTKFKGDSSDVVAAEAVKFIREKSRQQKPFFAYVCFASPHLPHKALAKDRAHYSKLPEKMQHFLGEITAMDRAIGSIRDELRKLGIADNTIVIFCGDNGAIPIGSTGGLRGRKGSLWEGGVRVPGLIEWPSRITKGRQTDVPCVTSDIFPTLVDLLGVKHKSTRPMDGISVKGLIDGKMKKRPTPIAFWKYRGGGKGESYLPKEKLKGWWRTFTNRKYTTPRTKNFPGHAALVDNRYKLHQLAPGKYELYDIITDAKESKNIAKNRPQIVKRMAKQLHAWQRSVERSLTGADYKTKGSGVFFRQGPGGLQRQEGLAKKDSRPLTLDGQATTEKITVLLKYAQ